MLLFLNQIYLKEKKMLMNALKSTSIQGYVIFNNENEDYWACLANTFVKDIAKATIFTSEDDVLNTLDEIADDNDKIIIKLVIINIEPFDYSCQLRMERKNKNG